ncbi:hypothetical protein ABPG77_009040 [Micractinium sp. CCAP 211/92]
MVRPREKRTRRDGAAGPEPTSETAPRVTQLMDLHDGLLQHIVKRLGVDRRTVMLVCKRLRDLARRVVHSRQLPGMSVQDAVEAAEPGDTVHLLPGFYKEALLLKKPLHLTCDAGRARILSPARFAIMATGRGCLLENLVLKSHQIDESVFFLVEFGPRCQHIRMRHCEVLQGSYIGIQDLKDDHTLLSLEHCQLHVGISLMAGRLEMTDCEVKCTGDSLWTHPETTLIMRRCSFVDIADPVTVQSSTAVIQGCSVWAYERGPLVVCCEELPLEEQVPLINEERLLYMEEEPPKDVWIAAPRGIAGPEGVRATGRRASPEERLRVERGDVLPGRVVLWGNKSFESRSNEGITAQQEEVRREARAIMEQMQRDMEVGDGMDPDEFSIGNSVEDPEPAPGEESDDSDDWDSDDSWEDHAGAGLQAGNNGVIDLLSSDGTSSGSTGSSSDDSTLDDSSSNDGSSLGDSSSDDGSSPGSSRAAAVAMAAFLPAAEYLQMADATTSSGEEETSSSSTDNSNASDGGASAHDQQGKASGSGSSSEEGGSSEEDSGSSEDDSSEEESSSGSEDSRKS